MKWSVANKWILPSGDALHIVYMTKNKVDKNLGGVYQEDVQLCLKNPGNLHIGGGVSRDEERGWGFCHQQGNPFSFHFHSFTLG